MPTIDIIIRNKTASAVNTPHIVCGNSDYNVKFDFDEEWQAHNNKIGVFAYNRCGEWQSEKVLFEGDICPVPVLHGVRSVWIGVTAGDVRTSTPADVPCRIGATDFTDTTEKPSDDIWGQIISKIENIEGALSSASQLKRLHTVVTCHDDDTYTSSINFDTLADAAKKPNEYIVTAEISGFPDFWGERTTTFQLISYEDTHSSSSTLIFYAERPKITNEGMMATSVYIILKKDGTITQKEVKNNVFETDNNSSIFIAGTNNKGALGGHAINLGPDAGAKGTNAIATGYVLYHPRYGFAFKTNTATGYNAIAAGGGATAEGNNSFALGEGAKATGNGSAAIGTNVEAYGNQFVCGRLNEPDSEQRYQFIVGISGKNGFAVTKEGQIVMPDPNTKDTTYMQACFNSDGTITLTSLSDDTKQYTTECKSNRVKSITDAATDDQYPTAKAVYAALQSLPTSTAETWTIAAETTTTEVTSTIYLAFPACRKVRILIDKLGGVTSGQVQVILNAGQDPYIGEARAAIAKTSFSTSSKYIAGVVQVDADWCIGGMQYGYAAIGARADGAQKDLMQPPVSMMWANATAYTTAKKTYKETGITEVCIKGVSLPTDSGFDVGAHIIVEGVAK